MSFNTVFQPLNSSPCAVAQLHGSPDHPDICGSVRFYQTRRGVLVAAEVWGLPTRQGEYDSPVFGFHIHSGGSCTGNASDPFADALSHYDCKDHPHPYHSGDLPPLFGNHGYAAMVVLTDRFCAREIIGKTVIIHSAPDDFTTQPSGNSGIKIACGVITDCRRG